MAPPATKKSKSETPAKSSIPWPGPSKLLHECTWVLPKFSKTFPNVFDTPNKLTSELRYERIKDSIVRYNYKADKDGKFIAPGTTVCATIKPLLIGVAGYRHSAPDTDDGRILLIVDAFFMGTGTKECKEETTILLYLTDEAGTRLVAPSCLVSYGRNRENVPYCHIRSELTLQSLWKRKEKLFPTDTIRLHFRVLRPHRLAKLSLNRDMSHLFETGDKTDFTIKCGSSDFKVHGLILGARSPVFKAMLSNDMREREKKEVIISDMNAEIFKILLEFVYSSTLPLNELGYDKLKQLVHAADKYQISELKDLCFSSLIEYICIEQITELATIAHRYKAAEWVRKQTFDFCIKHFATLREDPKFKNMAKECFDEFFTG